MSLPAHFRITRPHNAVVAGLAAALGYLIATGSLTPGVLLLVVVVACITAGGNVLNDVFDIEIDRINRPERPIPSGAVSLNGARLFAGLLFLVGVAASLFTNILCLGFAVVNTLILIAYAVRLKKTPLFGNIAVAYLAASIFLFGGAFAGIDGLVQNLPLAGITFLATVARELLKDAEDVDGDAAGGARTLPMIVGIRKTALLAFACVCGAVIASYLPVGNWWGLFYLIGIGVVDLIILAGAGKGLFCETPACVRSSEATSLLRIGMFSALLVFTVAALI